MTETLDVCICTYRRAALADALASLGRQQLPAGLALRVIVADNDALPVRREEILALGSALGLALDYVHAPARNISVARNACLDAARADWIAFIDDDEQAAADWAGRLFATRGKADIIFGVSRATYGDPAIPAWIAAGDFHSNRIGGNDAAWNGYTANVLIDRRLIAARGLRFSPALGQSGGEDTMFFLAAYEAGATFGYEPAAIVFEQTDPARATLRWLSLRRFRSGQIHYLVLARTGGRRRGAALAAAKALASFGLAALSLGSRVRAARHFLRGMLHAGVVASALGAGLYREYGEAGVAR